MRPLVSAALTVVIAGGCSKGAPAPPRASVPAPAASAPALRAEIPWPEGCARTAAAPGEHRPESACEDALRAVHDWPTGCEREYPRDLFVDGAPQITFHPLAPGRFLVAVPCSSGAYNERQVYLLYDEAAPPARAHVLSFVVFDDVSGASPRRKTAQAVFGRSFDPETGELVTLVKYRGLGDCGEFARYRFPGGKPELREARAKVECDGERIFHVEGAPTASPQGWRRLFP